MSGFVRLPPPVKRAPLDGENRQLSVQQPRLPVRHLRPVMLIQVVERKTIWPADPDGSSRSRPPWRFPPRRGRRIALTLADRHWRCFFHQPLESMHVLRSQAGSAS